MKIKVNSSALLEIEYNEDKELLVKFTSFREYVYFDVPKDKFEKMIKADSVGRFFNKEIKNNYEYVEIGE